MTVFREIFRTWPHQALVAQTIWSNTPWQRGDWYGKVVDNRGNEWSVSEDAFRAKHIAYICAAGVGALTSRDLGVARLTDVFLMPVPVPGSSYESANHFIAWSSSCLVTGWGFNAGAADIFVGETIDDVLEMLADHERDDLTWNIDLDLPILQVLRDAHLEKAGRTSRDLTDLAMTGADSLARHVNQSELGFSRFVTQAIVRTLMDEWDNEC